VATTWDSGNKSSGITLSGGSLVATAASSTNPSVVATRCATGKVYWEVTVTTQSSNFSVGFVGRSYNTGLGTLLGGDANGLGYRQGGAVVLNNATLSTIQTFTQGSVVQVALDLQNLLVWFAVGGGNWNNSGTANPATGVGGISFSAFAASYLPAFGAAVVTPNQVATAAFSSAGWTFSAPSGFQSVDGVYASGEEAATLGPTHFYTAAPAREDPVTTHEQIRVFFIQPGTRFWSPAATQTNVSGTVTESGSPVAKKVRLYDKVTGDLLGEVTSSAVDGSYSIPALGRASTVPMAFDDPTYNALVYDRVVPV
jgi:hypothetical protein